MFAFPALVSRHCSGVGPVEVGFFLFPPWAVRCGWKRVAPGVTQEAGAEGRQLAAGGHGRMRVNIYGEQTRLWLRIEAVLGWLVGRREGRRQRVRWM